MEAAERPGSARGKADVTVCCGIVSYYAAAHHQVAVSVIASLQPSSDPSLWEDREVRRLSLCTLILEAKAGIPVVSACFLVT